jgi:fucose 4-O-acetylase-like acetyltransferase
MRLATIDQLKGLAIIGVVCYHLNDWRLTIDTGWLMMLFGWCVFAFLFAAGVLHGLKFTTKPAGEFIRQRTQRLLIPFLLIGALMCGLRQVMEATGTIELRLRYPATLGGKLLGHVLLETPMVAYPLYFFILLLVVSVLFKLLEAGGIKETHLPWVAVGTLVLSVLAWRATDVLPVTSFGLQMVLLGLFQYTCGHLMSRDSAPRACPVVWVLVGVLLLLSVVTRVPQFVLVAMPPLLFYALGCAGRNGWQLKPLVYLGERSGTIFAYHVPFITGSLLVIFHKLQVPDALNLLLTLVGTLAICSVIHYVLHRWAIFKWFRV